jgi:hypothetical protein
MESGNYAAVQIAEALSKNNMKLVPDILVSSNGGNEGGNPFMNVLLASLASDQLKGKKTEEKKD